MKKHIYLLLISTIIIYFSVAFVLWDLLWFSKFPQNNNEDRATWLICYAYVLYTIDFFYFSYAEKKH